MGFFEKNKKRAAGLAMILAATSCLLAGCGTSDNGDYSKYVTLGDYRSLQVTMHVEKVTDEELQQAIQDAMSSDQELHDKQGVIEAGDYVTIGLLAMDGKEVLYDFTDADGYEMLLLPEEFGQAFVDELVGASKGDQLKFTVPYPAEFEETTLAGKDVNYEVDIRDISTVTYPELTDKYVKENFEAASVDEWKASLKEELQQEHENDAIDTMRSDLLNQAVEGSVINGYPKELYNKQKRLVDEEYQGYADMFGSSVSEIYEMFGLDKEALKQQYLDATNSAMVTAEIVRNEHLEMSESELQQGLAEYAAEEEYDSVEELLAEYNEDSIKEYLLTEKVLDFLEANAQITREETTAE